jgi:glycosyltransferase involved in cell wall biosynthesis
MKALIFPCFNEAHRINVVKLNEFINSVGADTFFVDDGSTDRSTQLLTEVKNVSKFKIEVLALEKNIGKTNAIRHGLMYCAEQGYQTALIQDIDLPFSASDVLKSAQKLKESDSDICSGARVRLAGSPTFRSPLRHWAGRIVATLIYIFYSSDFYDPQSPCKAYKLKSVIPLLNKPLKTRWFGDIELLRRARKSEQKIKTTEFTLEEWKDVPDGKIKLGSLFAVAVDFLKIRIT